MSDTYVYFVDHGRLAFVAVGPLSEAQLRQGAPWAEGPLSGLFVGDEERAAFEADLLANGYVRAPGLTGYEAAALCSPAVLAAATESVGSVCS